VDSAGDNDVGRANVAGRGGALRTSGRVLLIGDIAVPLPSEAAAGAAPAVSPH
jgi:hypothetical protein